MTSIVLDASAALHIVLRLDGFESLAAVVHSASTVAAPRLFVAETTNALWKYTRSGNLVEQEALDRLREALSLVTHPIDDDEMAIEALSTAARYGHPAYDAMYAVLARRLGGAVVTRDRRLRSLLAELRVDVAP